MPLTGYHQDELTGARAWSSLPTATVKAICQQLDQVSVLQARLVCNDWHTSFTAGVTQASILLSSRSQSVATQLQSMSKVFPDLHSVTLWLPARDVHDCTIHSLTLHHVEVIRAAIPKLTSLKVDQVYGSTFEVPNSFPLAPLLGLEGIQQLTLCIPSNIPAEDFVQFTRLNELERLDLRHGFDGVSRLTEAHLVHLPALTGLKDLQFNVSHEHSGLLDTALYGLKAIRGLTTLVIGGTLLCSNNTAGALFSLATLPSLLQLSLPEFMDRKAAKFAGQFPDVLGRLRAVTSLEMVLGSNSSALWPKLKGLETLQSLVLGQGDAEPSSGDKGDRGISGRPLGRDAMSCLQHLRSLELQEVALDSVASLGQLTALTHLHLNGCELGSSSGLLSLGRLHGLHSLVLAAAGAGLKLDDGCLASLVQSATCLTMLEFSGDVTCTRQGLRVLGSLLGLRRLALSHPGFGCGMVVELEALPAGLTSLALRNATLVLPRTTPTAGMFCSVEVAEFEDCRVHQHGACCVVGAACSAALSALLRLFSRVTTLCLTDCGMCDGTLTTVAQEFRRLVHLGVRECERTSISDAGVVPLARLAQLQELALELPLSDGVSGAAVRALAGLHHLKALELVFGKGVVNEELDVLTQLSALRTLGLRHANIHSQLGKLLDRLAAGLPCCDVTLLAADGPTGVIEYDEEDEGDADPALATRVPSWPAPGAKHTKAGNANPAAYTPRSRERSPNVRGRTPPRSPGCRPATASGEASATFGSRRGRPTPPGCRTEELPPVPHHIRRQTMSGGEVVAGAPGDPHCPRWATPEAHSKAASAKRGDQTREGAGEVAKRTVKQRREEEGVRPPGAKPPPPPLPSLVDVEADFATIHMDDQPTAMASLTAVPAVPRDAAQAGGMLQHLQAALGSLWPTALMALPSHPVGALHSPPVPLTAAPWSGAPAVPAMLPSPMWHNLWHTLPPQGTSGVPGPLATFSAPAAPAPVVDWAALLFHSQAMVLGSCGAISSTPMATELAEAVRSAALMPPLMSGPMPMARWSTEGQMGLCQTLSTMQSSDCMHEMVN